MASRKPRNFLGVALPAGSPMAAAIASAAASQRGEFNACTILRHRRVTHSTLNTRTGERSDVRAEWETAPCNAPLFGDANRRRGICDSCARKWEHPANRRADSCTLAEAIAAHDSAAAELAATEAAAEAAPSAGELAAIARAERAEALAADLHARAERAEALARHCLRVFRGIDASTLEPATANTARNAAGAIVGEFPALRDVPKL